MKNRFRWSQREAHESDFVFLTLWICPVGLLSSAPSFITQFHSTFLKDTPTSVMPSTCSLRMFCFSTMCMLSPAL